MNHKKPEPKRRHRVKRLEDRKKISAPKRAVIDLKLVHRYAALFFRDWEIAAALGIGKTTFAEHKVINPGIQQAIDAGRDVARGNIRRLQFAKAMKGDTAMLIWIGKQELDQKEKQELSNDPKNPITFTLAIGHKDIKET